MTSTFSRCDWIVSTGACSSGISSRNMNDRWFTWRWCFPVQATSHVSQMSYGWRAGEEFMLAPSSQRFPAEKTPPLSKSNMQLLFNIIARKWAAKASDVTPRPCVYVAYTKPTSGSGTKQRKSLSTSELIRISWFGKWQQTFQWTKRLNWNLHIACFRLLCIRYV